MNPSLIKKVVKKVKEKKERIADKMKENSKEGKGLLGLDKKDTSGPGMSMPGTPALDPYPSFSAGRVGVDGSESKPTKPSDYRDAPYAPAYDAGYGSTSRREF